jgi:hypothetical protein
VTESGPTFHMVSDGYDPDEVDRRIAELVHATKTAQQHAHELHLQLADQEHVSPEPDDLDQNAEPDFAALGEHVGNLIRAAHETALAIDADAQADAEALRTQAQQLVAAAKADAETIIAAANQRVAVTRRQRDEIFAELAQLRDRLPSVLGAGADRPAPASPSEVSRN